MEHPVVKDYDKVVEYLQERFDEITGDTFYEEIFPNNEDIWEENTHYQKPNAIYLYYDESKDRFRRRIMFKDTWIDDFNEYVVDNPMTLCSGLSFRGRRNTLENAQKLHALIFDLDSVGGQEIELLFLRLGKGIDEVLGAMPMPTYIVCSGSGLHLYYLLDVPIDLYPNIKLQLKKMKHNLTEVLWDQGYTTKEETVQYQGIAQGFRMVGSLNNKHGHFRIRAFRTGSPVSLETLNEYVTKDNRVDLTRRFRPTSCSLAEAQIKWEDWYETRIVHGIKPKQWHIKEDLYNWWLRQLIVERKVKGGHRYFFLMCLAIYAVKCGISKKRLKDDMEDVFPLLANISHENPFTQRDIDSALEAYDRGYYCFTRDDIAKLSGITILPNMKRRSNDKKISQSKHLQLARNRKRDMKDLEIPLKNPDGRPKNSGIKAQQVYEWRLMHLNGLKVDCERDTGLSKPTVLKWWNWTPDEQKK